MTIRRDCQMTDDVSCRWQLLQSVAKRDLNVVQAIVLLLVWSVLLINFLVDVAYQLVDPRVRRRAEAA